MPVIKGLVRRRILINYRVIPEVMQTQLPAKFRPKLHAGFGIAGICLMRLEEVRRHGFPAFLGVSAENAAHRFAVLWENEAGQTCEGIYIARRDTDSKVNLAGGGWLFPGEHQRARFEVKEEAGGVDLSLVSNDQQVVVQVRGQPTKHMPYQSGFQSPADAANFFQAGAGGGGQSPGNAPLRKTEWIMQPLRVEHVYSNYFSDVIRFPQDTLMFDSALITHNVSHEWSSESELYS
jgi:hypothetical protein